MGEKPELGVRTLTAVWFITCFSRQLLAPPQPSEREVVSTSQRTTDGSFQAESGGDEMTGLGDHHPTSQT